jgi:prolactin regulatory element-binding protein
VNVSKADIYDITFSLTTVRPSPIPQLYLLNQSFWQLVVATTINLLVYSLPKPSNTTGKAKLVDLELLQTIERPNLPGAEAGSNFRAARFDPNDYEVLYTMSNTVPARSTGRGRSKQAPRLAYVCKWDVKTWKVKSKRKIGDKAATCFDLRHVLKPILKSHYQTDILAVVRTVSWLDTLYQTTRLVYSMQVRWQ